MKPSSQSPCGAIVFCVVVAAQGGAAAADEVSLRRTLDDYRAAAETVAIADEATRQGWLDQIDRSRAADERASQSDLYEARLAALALSNSLGDFKRSLRYADELVDVAENLHVRAYWLVEQAELAAMLPSQPDTMSRIDRACKFVSQHPEFLQTTEHGPSAIIVNYVSVLARKARILAEGEGDGLGEARAALDHAQQVIQTYATETLRPSLAQLGYDDEYFAASRLSISAKLGDRDAVLAEFERLRQMRSLRLPEGDYALQVYSALRRKVPAEAVSFLADWYGRTGGQGSYGAAVAKTIALHYLEGSDYSRAVRFLEAALQSEHELEEHGLLEVLLATAYGGLGDKETERRILTRVLSEYPQTKAFRIAEEALGASGSGDQHPSEPEDASGINTVPGAAGVRASSPEASVASPGRGISDGSAPAVQDVRGMDPAQGTATARAAQGIVSDRSPVIAPGPHKTAPAGSSATSPDPTLLSASSAVDHESVAASAEANREALSTGPVLSDQPLPRGQPPSETGENEVTGEPVAGRSPPRGNRPAVVIGSLVGGLVLFGAIVVAVLSAKKRSRQTGTG